MELAESEIAKFRSARQIANEKGEDECRSIGSLLVIVGITNKLLKRRWWPSEMTQDEATIALGALYKTSENVDACFSQMARLKTEDRQRQIRALIRHLWIKSS
jgi:hypothetical protein